jgi:hypothetical protein
MNIDDIKNIYCHLPLQERPFVDPRLVLGIDSVASRKFYERLWHNGDYCALDDEKSDPESDAKSLFNYVYEIMSYSIRDDIRFTPLNAIEMGLFFMRELGYIQGAALIILSIKFDPCSMYRKSIFCLFKKSYEEETTPYIKWNLEYHFLDFFGFDYGTEEICFPRCLEGLPYEEREYLTHLHAHRSEEP